MDLHIVAPLASAGERAAVDAILDPVIGHAVAGRGGIARDEAGIGRGVQGGHEARSHGDLLLPALLAVQARVGWVSEPALAYICRRLSVPPADAHGVVSFYSMLATSPRPPAVVHVCEDLACRLAGSEELCADLEERLGPAGEPALGGRATWLRGPCLGRCERAPAVLFQVAGEEPEVLAEAPANATDVVARLEDSVAGRRIMPAPHSTAPSPERMAHLRRSAPQAGSDGLHLLRRVGRIDPTSLDDYLAAGGYAALRRAIEIGRAAVIEEVSSSRLLGRGGAAFPTGRKWAAVAEAPAQPHYVVCNADESEPGTFKDRVLMEEDPFSVVEAMTIEGFATRAVRGFLYLRAEYPLCAERIGAAIELARAADLLGEDILGSGFSFDIEVRRGAGAYVCGEETALFESIEGRRGEPRNKPPFPVEVGLFGKPTAVNNIETVVNVPVILTRGAAAFAAMGTAGSAGPKLFCISGEVATPGLYEVPFGATLRDLIDLAGGAPSIKAVLIGGAAGAFVTPDRLDMPLTFEGTRAEGASLGSGVVIVYGEGADIAGALLRIAAFFRDESCGQCVPCRIGTVRQEELIARVLAGRPNGSLEAELALFRDLAQAMRDASICGLGQLAPIAIESAFEHLDLFTGAGR
jgi:NADH-quinone oxidoreductase subunit F